MLTIYNTLTRSKELFEPLVPGHVGMYVCGPTVYGDPHLGHARSAVVFDLLFRYLTAMGLRVRYVRNITDVGHLEHDADEGEDKIAKKARLEQLEPMEVAQLYTRRYHDCMRELNVLPPSIEPRASGHMIEQLEMLRDIRGNNRNNHSDGHKYGRYAYTRNGSVYFNVRNYNKNIGKDFPYGSLSNRILDDQISESRQLAGQNDIRKSPYDFALWKDADPMHILRWKSPVPGKKPGFPGWHLECSAMSKKYLGEEFDIHGGGMDLIFPHHECEIAQSRVANNGKMPARYWVHNNMITIGGQKMGKSLGNFITLEQLFTGSHPLLEQAYSPMTIRFFMLQAHYRSTLDFSNEALQAAEKGLDRLMKAVETLGRLAASEGAAGMKEIAELETRLDEAMDDDLGSPLVIAALFDAVRVINSLHDGAMTICATDLDRLREIFHRWVFDILGLRDEKAAGAAGGTDHLSPVVEMLLGMRADAKADKNWALSDRIRDGLAAAGIKIMDKKDGTSEWQLQ